MSELANPSQMVTATLAWREPNGQVIQFGDGAGSAAVAVTPAATSSGSSSSSNQESPGGSAHGASIIDLFA